MGTKRRQKLLSDAVPTLFCFTKPTIKRKASDRRYEKSKNAEEIDQLLQQASTSTIGENEQSLLESDNFNDPSNTPIKPMKECSVQTTLLKTRSIKTQCNESIPIKNKPKSPAIVKITKKTPFLTKSKCCNTELSFGPFENVSFIIEPAAPSTEETDEYEITEKHEKDEPFVLETDSSEDEANEDLSQEESKSENLISEPKFIVFWSRLLTLFTFCRYCFQSCVVDKVLLKGSAVIIKTLCTNGHEYTWTSQPEINGYFSGNIFLSAAILYSGNTYARISQCFKMINVILFSSSNFYKVQKKFLFPAINKFYKATRSDLLKTCIASNDNHFSGDGRCDSPGYSAKYGTYSLMDTKANKIVDFYIVHVGHATNSSVMEKTGLKVLLDKFIDLGINIKSLTTDRHTQIRAMMRDKYPSISHQFDIWHFTKSIKKKLSKHAKGKGKADLNDWIKSVINHIWWCCATCDNNFEVLKEKWLSVLSHIRGVHTFKGNKHFKKCQHAKLKKKRKWLKKDSPAFKALKSVLEDNRVLADLKQLVEFRHTGNLEVFHSVINKYCPKRLHFSFYGMIARTQLAILDFNSGSDNCQAITKEGDLRYKQVFSRVTQSWVIKKVMKKKKYDYLQTLLQEIVEVTGNLTGTDLPEVGEIPKNIAKKEKPSKEEAIKNMKTRFSF